jgi:molybdopterin biosynthesis enzyme
MSRANGLMIIPENATSVESGTQVQVQMLDWDEGAWLGDEEGES